MAFLDSAGYRLHYQWASEVRPDRPTVIFLHDGLGAIGSWRTLPRQLADALDVNALAYDRWGYGRSDPREVFTAEFMEAEVAPLLELVDHLELERPFLVGHSDGGSISLLYAAWHPGRVSAVVTEAAHTYVEPICQEGIRALVRLQANGETPPWLHKLHGERGDAVLSAWSEHWLSGVHGRWNIEEHLHRVRCPLLVIQGDRDEFGTEAQVDSILAAVPGAQSWIVPDCGHTPHSQVEEEFLARLIGFLGPLLPRDAAAK